MRQNVLSCTKTPPVNYSEFSLFFRHDFTLSGASKTPIFARTIEYIPRTREASKLVQKYFEQYLNFIFRENYLKSTTILTENNAFYRSTIMYTIAEIIC